MTAPAADRSPVTPESEASPHADAPTAPMALDFDLEPQEGPAGLASVDLDLDAPATAAAADAPTAVWPGGAGGGDQPTEPYTPAMTLGGHVDAPEAPSLPPRPPLLSMALPPGHRLQEFEVRSALGQGGFSIVYRAWDHALRREVALKEFLPAGLAFRRPDQQVVPISDNHRETFVMGLRSFVEEGVTLAKFDHPALVRVYRNFEANGTAYMVMQLVEGETLDAAAQRMPQPVDEGWLLDLLDPLTTALHVVHRARIVHRDIAPDNIMLLKGTQQPLLLDFGAARQVIGDVTHQPTAILKPSYAPIEQYPESGIVQGAHTDIYALAGVIHRLLTGSAPPNAQGRMLRDSYLPLSERLAGHYSASLLRAVDHALAVQPGQRPADIPTFRRELGLDELRSRRQAAAAISPAVATSEPPTAASRRPAWVWGAAALAVAGAGVWWSGALNGGENTATGPQSSAVAPSPSGTPAASGAGGDAASNTGGGGAPAGEAAVAQAAANLPAMPTTPASTALDQLVQAAAPEMSVTLSLSRHTLKLNQTPLNLRLSATQAGYYHLLLLDTDGEVRLLFPAPGQPPGRIQAGQSLNLPPSTVDPATGLERQDNLIFSEPAGQARLVALVSALPLDWSGLRQGAEGDPQRLIHPRRPLPGATPSGAPFYLGMPLCATGQACDVVRYGAAQARFQVIP